MSAASLNPRSINSLINASLFLMASGLTGNHRSGLGFFKASAYKARPTLIFSERINARSRWAIKLPRMSWTSFSEPIARLENFPWVPKPLLAPVVPKPPTSSSTRNNGT